jgi:uncharacterized protein YukE
MAWQHRVEVEIEELGRFRTLLQSAAAQLQEVHAGLERQVEQLSETWRDEHQRQFADAFAATGSALTTFAASAERYAFYLWQKAEAIAAYTGIAPPDGGGAAATLGPASGAGTVISPAESAFEAAVAVAAAAVRVSAESLLSRWDCLGPDKRLAKLGQIQAELAVAQERPAIPVIAAPTNPKCLGSFDGRTIRLNQLSLVDGMGQTMLETLIHEDRHAYQYYAVRNRDFHPEAAQVQEWRWNLDQRNYRGPSRHAPWRYASQPIEADAFSFTAAVMRRIGKGQVDV